MSRYTIPPDYSGGDSEDRQAMLDWQDSELSSEDDRLNAEDDRPTDSQARAAGGVEAWYKQRDEHRKENRDA
jgi:hypothetical protein|tara:strand:- start:447 stop:662 length:216 start_codon:yes stop_codon:yes gene_type:complete